MVDPHACGGTNGVAWLAYAEIRRTSGRDAFRDLRIVLAVDCMDLLDGRRLRNVGARFNRKSVLINKTE